MTCNTYYDCWITLQTALKIDACNLYCKITLVWLDSSLRVVTCSIFVHLYEPWVWNKVIVWITMSLPGYPTHMKHYCFSIISLHIWKQSRRIYPNNKLPFTGRSVMHGGDDREVWGWPKLSTFPFTNKIVFVFGIKLSMLIFFLIFMHALRKIL